MRDFTHYVVSSNSGAGLNYDVSPLNRARDLPPFPQRIARWGCDGPYLIAWGHTVMTHKPLADQLFLPTHLDTNAVSPIGNWIRRRRKTNTNILHP
jgi:hypothetical protein